jgi:RNA-directed DNA polymerase
VERHGLGNLKFSWAKITRHTLVKGWASPDDPALAGYWVARRHRGKPPLGRARLRLLQAQHGRCPLCGDLLLHAEHEPRHPDEWEQWITATRKAIRRQALVITGPGMSDERTAFRLTHTHCRDRQPGDTGSEPAPQLRA